MQNVRVISFRVGVSLAAGLTFATPAVAAEELIGEYTVDANFGFLGVAQSASITTFLSPDFGVFSGEGTLFEDSNFVNGDSVVREMTYGEDPDFERYVELLTDGQDWYLYDQLNFDNGVLNGRFERESFRLPLDPPPDPNEPTLRAPDLAGFEITRIVRTVEISIESPGTNPNGDGNWTSVLVFVQTDIYGVPEPGTLLLGALGGCWALRRRGPSA